MRPHDASINPNQPSERNRLVSWLSPGKPQRNQRDKKLRQKSLTHSELNVKILTPRRIEGNQRRDEMRSDLVSIYEVIVARFVSFGRDELYVRNDVAEWSDADIIAYAQNLIAFGIITD